VASYPSVPPSLILNPGQCTFADHFVSHPVIFTRYHKSADYAGSGSALGETFDRVPIQAFFGAVASQETDLMGRIYADTPCHRGGINVLCTGRCLCTPARSPSWSDEAVAILGAPLVRTSRCAWKGILISPRCYLCLTAGAGTPLEYHSRDQER
jgi:hypothetical protein